MIIWEIKDKDIIFDSIGRPKVVSDVELLTQLTRQMLLMETDKRGFGANLGKTGFDITVEIHEAVRRWLMIQNKSKFIRDIKLYKIEFLDVIQRDKTSVKFSLSILSNKGQEQRLEMTI